MVRLGLGGGCKVLGQFQTLALVVRRNARAVKLCRDFGHMLIDQATNDLAVLQHKGRFVAADF